MVGYEELRSILAGERLPVALVDLDAFDRNLDRLLGVAREHGLALRVASKSVRVPALLERTLRKGARGLMCFSVEEAARLAARGMDDILIAYPTVQRAALAELAAMSKRGMRVSLAIDDRDTALAVQDAAAQAETIVSVVIDVDMSLRALGRRVHVGVRRSPLHDPDDVLNLAQYVQRARHLRLAGLLAYEAQVAGLPDDNPAARAIHRASMRDIRARRPAIVSALEGAGIALELVNGGGTGSIDETTRETGVTEITAGSGLYKSTLFDGYTSKRVRALEPALFFALEAVRRPSPRHVTCAGGGYVASGPPGKSKHPTPVLPEGLRLLSMEMTGEVQTPLEGDAASTVRLGDPVLFRPAKAGEPLERFAEVVLLSGGKIVDRAPTYRGLGWTFF